MKKIIKHVVVLAAAGAALTGCVEDHAYVSDYYSSHSYYGDGYYSGPAPASVRDRSYSTTGSGYSSDETPPSASRGFAGSAQGKSGYSSTQTPAQTQSGYSSSQTPSQTQSSYSNSGSSSTGNSGYSSSTTTQASSGVIAVPVLPKRTINQNEDRAAASGDVTKDDGGYSSSN